MSSRKCPMCRSRKLEKIKNPTERPFKLSDDEEIIIYPITKCLNCGAEFDIRKKDKE